MLGIYLQISKQIDNLIDNTSLNRSLMYLRFIDGLIFLVILTYHISSLTKKKTYIISVDAEKV